MKNVFSILFILWSTYGFAQSKAINQYDDQGERHGVWKKYFDKKNKDGKKQVRYEGEFDHGKEVGTFKFYKPNYKDQPAATRTFNPNDDTVKVKYYNKKGYLISEGKMVAKNREGEWRYYRKNDKKQLVTKESYTRDTLDGWQITYYPNGKTTEKRKYKMGKKEGEHKIYAKNGKLSQEYHYKNDKFHGHSKTYDAHGKVSSEGSYKKGLRDGEWKFYTDGQLDSIQKYPLKKHVKNRYPEE